MRTAGRAIRRRGTAKERETYAALDRRTIPLERLIEKALGKHITLQGVRNVVVTEVGGSAAGGAWEWNQEYVNLLGEDIAALGLTPDDGLVSHATGGSRLVRLDLIEKAAKGGRR